MVLETVEETITRYDLLKKKDNVLLAFSGGLDSTGLLAVFLELRDEWLLGLYLGHFNHRLRPGADHDEQFVKKVAQEHSLPLFVGAEDVRTYAGRKGINLEEAGRILRYDFLTRTARKIGGAKIATGHTLNDQAETFFLRLMRGSGLKGLGSIYPVIEGQIIRPLLAVERKDMEEFVQGKGFTYRDDESNLDRNFARNKVRLDLIPFIQHNFDPKILQRIGKTVAILQEEDALLDTLSSRKSRSAISSDGDILCLDLGVLKTLPRGLARRIVREFIRRLKGDLRRISFEYVESVLNMEKGKSLTLPEELVLVRKGDHVFQRRESPGKMMYLYEWDGSDPLVIEELNLVVEAKRTERPPSFVFDDESRAYLDGDLAAFPLKVRSRQEGDRYRPLGAPGRKKLKEIMRAKPIPLEERDKRPVFLSGDEIVWVLGLPVAEKYRVHEKTKKVLVLSVASPGQR